MDIREPKNKEYIKGNLDPDLFFAFELKKSEYSKRILKENPTIIEKLREEMWFPNKDIVKSEVKNIVDKINGVRVVKYMPTNLKEDNVIIYFHGGGYYGGSTDTIQNSCRYLAEQTFMKVISVDYSLAPEFPFPKALEEGYEIVKYYSNRFNNIYIAGDSAGGGLACSICIKDIENDTRIIKGLIMYYPVLLIDLKDNVMEDFIWDIKEYDIDPNSNHLSLLKSESIGLKYAMSFIKDTYIKSHIEKDNYLVSPICVPNHILDKFPKTLIFTAEYDYLRLEAEYFYKRLKKQGIFVKGIRYRGQTHAFFDKIGYCDQVIDSINEIKEFLK